MSIIVGVHVFLLILGVSSVGFRGAAFLGVIYIIAMAAYTAARIYKENF